MKIGVFDSGVGGMTVLSELQFRMPDLSFVYLGDTAHVPYGTKSAAQIEKLSIQCARRLQEKKIDVLVVACNTASSLALDALAREMHPVPVFGVVQPGIEAVLTSLEALLPIRGNDVPILVLATRATIRSHAYGKKLAGVVASPRIIEQACPLLVPMIEEGWTDHPLLHQTIHEYIHPYLKFEEPGVALLGCTHYPWIHRAFEQALPGWKVVNSARAIAESLERSEIFRKRKKVPPEVSGSFHFRSPKIEWIFTDPEAVPDFAKKWIEAN